MSDPFSFIIAFLIGGGVAAAVLLIVRRSPQSNSKLEGRLYALEQGLERGERLLREELARSREEAAEAARRGREETAVTLKAFGEALATRMLEIGRSQRGQMEIFGEQLQTLTKSNEERLEKLRDTLDLALRQLREDNAAKLEQMRATVDEKLHDTLEKRLGESFKLVSDRLEMVHRGLGEMQTLAVGVGDLKRVLTNVKTRGTFGEIQLGALLEQILTPDQYETNAATKKGSQARVEFAIRLPGRDGDEPVLLPVDAKFPQEDYLRLQEAEELGDSALVEEASRQLERTVKEMAKLISDKYLDPPNTTDFGIMFLPTEGLYAEVLRRPGLFELLQREQRVVITGPTTLAAFLNSLQMGFRTLAIEKRSSEVWTLLGAVKSEFGYFGVILDKTQKKLQEASTTIDNAARKSRTIQRKLKGIQELPYAEAEKLLETGDDGELSDGV